MADPGGGGGGWGPALSCEKTCKNTWILPFFFRWLPPPPAHFANFRGPKKYPYPNMDSIFIIGLLKRKTLLSHTFLEKNEIVGLVILCGTNGKVIRHYITEKNWPTDSAYYGDSLYKVSKIHSFSLFVQFNWNFYQSTFWFFVCFSFF